MSDHSFEKLDLNLLKVFRALYRYRTTTEAAKRVGMTQPGISNALRRMREQMDDPMFVWANNTLEPTNRADKLGAQIDNVMDELESLCYPPDLFEPETFSETIRIACSGGLIDSISPKLTKHLKKQLPNAKIELLHWSLNTLPELENGSIDIGLNHYPLSISKGIRQVMIKPESYCFLVRQGHPAIETGLPLEVIAQSELVGLIVPELTEDQAIMATSLKERGFNFVIRSEHLFTLFETVQYSDAVFVLTELAASCRGEGLVKISPEWLKELPTFSIALFLQQSQTQNPLHKWLIKEMRKVILERMKASSEG